LAQTTREIIERGRGQDGHSTSSQGAMWEPQLNRPLTKTNQNNQLARLQNAADVYSQKK
jgi:hypothetical protein